VVKGAGTTSTYGVTTTGGTGAAGGQNPYRFAPGSIYDRTTDMLKCGQRWYQPVTGRFTQQGNRYAYAGDDPINNTDPNGQSLLGISSAYSTWGPSHMTAQLTHSAAHARVTLEDYCCHSR